MACRWQQMSIFIAFGTRSNYLKTITLHSYHTTFYLTLIFKHEEDYKERCKISDRFAEHNPDYFTPFCIILQNDNLKKRVNKINLLWNRKAYDLYIQIMIIIHYSNHKLFNCMLHSKNRKFMGA